MAQATFVYDPTTARFQTELRDVYRVMRDEFPVYRDPEGRFFALSRFADVWNAVHDWAAFSNDHVAEADALMPQMIYMDPPRHTELRALVSRAFTPKRMADLEPRIREVARELIDRFAGSGRCDLVADFAAPLPSTVIGEAIGVPPEHLESFRDWTEQFISITGPEDFAEAAGKIYGLFGELLAERRREPRDDLMSALHRGRDRRRAPDRRGAARLLLPAPDRRQRHDHDPDRARRRAAGPPPRPAGRARGRPVADPGRGRGDAPDRGADPGAAPHRDARHRPARRDHPRGIAVMLVWGAANLDDREFADPERFDIHRRIQRHLSFGHGAHHCLGAALARLEGRVAFEELLGRIPEYEVVGTPVHYASSWARAFQALPLRFPPA